MSNPAETESLEGIAVIGMACRFPGAGNIDEFWRNIQQGVESISTFSDQELLEAGVEPALLRNPSYVRAAATLEEIDRFDAAFFGFNRREAEILDPQQRLFLECAYTALEHAGYDTERYDGLIGVYAGVGANGYVHNLLSNRELVEALGAYQIALANEKDFLATRLAYKLNLRGPSATVQTACSTSLVATHLACQSLLSFDCDIALVGGAAINIPHKAGYLYREGGIASPDGHCRAFDAQAAGTISGSGVGAVVLKRLADALADGDTIHAVIKSSAINNDGAFKVGFTAPSQDGQAAVISQALALAGIDPATIGYIEAHGTGTTLGDPIEVAALNQVFRAATDQRGFCALGSVKTNIGHLDAAAGMAGLIKAVLALKHAQIPPSLHFREPNPKIDFTDSPFYVATRLADWPAADEPRRAGVSSFGIGGTNAHVILEEAPHAAPAGTSRPAQLLVLSARTPAALDTATAELAAHLKRNPQLDLADIAYTLQAGRRAFAQRRIVASRDAAEAAAALEALDLKTVFSAAAQPGERPVVFMFPGQGAQHPRMAAELYLSEPTFREHLDHCAELLAPHLGVDIREVLYPTNDERRTTNDESSDSSFVLRPSSEAGAELDQTWLAQPALFAVEYALAQLWMSWGIQPQALIGHSLGEYVAATLAGVLDLEDALALVAARGRLMQALPGGAMLAVYLPEAELRPLLGAQLDLAAVNGPALCVVAGPAEAVAELARQLVETGAETRPLHVSHAFHSATMDAILEPFTALVEKIELRAPQIPYISNVSGTWISAAEATDPRYWAAQIRRTVRFADGIQALFADPARLLLEVGPGLALSTLAQRHPARPAEQVVLASLSRPNQREADPTTLPSALGRLWLTGVAVDWAAYHAHEQRRRIPLPTYPFERQRYWIDAAPAAQPPLAALPMEGFGEAAPHSSVRPSQESARFGGIASLQESSCEISLGAAQPLPSPHPINLGMETTMPDTRDLSAAPARHERILATLGVLINRLTGANLDEVGAQASVFDIGFDSLILIQFSQAIQDELGVKISLVQLLEQYNTLDSIAAYLDRALPPDALPAPAQPAAAPLAPQPAAQPPIAQPPIAQPYSAPAPLAPQPAQVYATAATQPGDALERILAQQIQLLAQQIDLLRGGAGQATTTIQNSSASSADDGRLTMDDNSIVHRPSSIVVATNGHSAATNAVAPVLPAGSPNDTRRVKPAPFVPYKPAEIVVNNDMTPRQREYLQAFIERYTARTQGSKRLAQQYRGPLADSRSTVAFRLAWKELVYPIVGKRSEGARIWDVDGNEYIDVTMGFGVHLFGHSPRFIMDAMEQQMKIGVQLGPQSYLAGEVARLICELTGAERVNFCNSGTEAVMGALRIARTVTRRTKIAIFAEAYHGWADGVLARPVLRDGKLQSVPMAPGVPPHAVEDLLVLEYDNPQSLETLKAHAHELAAVMVEPVRSRRPDVQPRAFLHALRELTTQAGIPLIFDEMVNGFRILPGGAQAWFGIQADIVTYGKIVGGGLPIGIVAGKAAYMDAFDGGTWSYGDDSYPEAEKTMFAGAFFKHPLTMAAALAVLNHIQAHGEAMYEQLNQRTTRLVERLNAYFEQQQVPIQVVHFSSTFRFNLAPEAKYLDLFFYHLIEKGVYIWEGTNFFLSTAHTDADLERFFEVVQQSVEDLRTGGFLPDLPPDSNGRAGSGGAGSGRPTTTVVTNGNGRHAPVSAAPAMPLARGARAPEFSLYYFGNYEAPFRADKYDLLLDGGKFADANGFSAVWIPERHFHSFGGFSPNPSVVAAALARETRRVQLRAGSVALPLHHPIRVAEEWSVVDNLSNGRAGVSFASGWHPDDFVFAPEAYERRREVMLEGIETVRKLWRGESVEVRGGAQSRIQARLFPMPRQRELPFWLTCVQKETFVKAGEIGAGVLTNLLDQSGDELVEKVALYREALARHGHPPEAGHVTVLVHTFLAETVEAAVQQARRPFYAYLRSSLGLVRNMAKSKGRQVDLERLPADELEYLLADAYERIVQTGALIGTPESCAPLVARLAASGVDEIACLIDFGVDAPAVLSGLEQLRTLKERADAPVAALSAAEVETPVAAAPIPLTEAQKGLWVLAQLGDTEARLYNEALALRLRGPLRVEALDQALQQVVARHEALRTTFSPDGDVQYVAPSLMIDLPLSDVSALEGEQRGARVEALLAQEVGQAFDLVAGPLLRARLIKLGEQEHVLALTIHHIVTDGWSIDIILQELAALYTAASAGETAALPVPRQFREYAAWLEQQEHSPEGVAAERYWLERFAGAIPALELPADRPRRPARTFAGAQQTFTIDAELGGKLRQLSARHGCTLFATLLAGFTTLLHRLSGHDDLIVGVPAAGQLALGDSYLAGYCLNLLPLRSTAAAHLPFAKHLTNVRRMVLEAYEHQAFSFGSLVKKLHLDRDLSRSPLVNVVFNMEKGSHESVLTFLDLKAEVVPSFSGFARFDINVNVFDIDGIISLQCDYSSDLFDDATIRRWLEHFQVLLAGAVLDAAQPIGALPLLSASDHDELLIIRNATAAPYPAERPFHELFAEQAARTPNAVAVVFDPTNDERGMTKDEGRTMNDEDSDSSFVLRPSSIVQLTYAELNARANQLAHHLRGLGVGPETRVGICMERSPELLVGLLGIFKAGGAFVPLDPSFPPERMAYILEDAQVRILVTKNERPTTNDERLSSSFVLRPSSFVSFETVDLTSDWEAIAHQPVEAPESGVGGANLAYLIYTSGSTGRPKGVLIPHSGLVNYLAWCVEAYGAAQGRGAPVHASIAADAIFPSLFAPLLAGTTVVMMPNEQPLEALGAALVREEPFSLIKITPSQLEVLNQQLPWDDAGAWVGTLVVGAEELRGQVLADWQRHLPGTILLNEYGPTETVVGCSIYQVTAPTSGSVPIGLPIANTTFYVLDARMQPVPIGVPGELYIGGDGVAWGYHNRPDLTAEKFVPNPFGDCRLQIADCRLDQSTICNLQSAIGTRLYKTGDLVRYLPDRSGNIEFLGRIDDQVKIRGYRVEPGEVEVALRSHEGVREAVVLAREDRPGERRLVAYIVPTNDQRPTTNDEDADLTFVLRPSSFVSDLRGFLKARLPDYMLPAAYVLLDAIPLAPHGKIDRKALPAPDAARPELETTFVAPRTPVEQQIAGIWSQLLDVEQIGAHDNFFELGGDSLLAVRLIARLRDTFAVELSARALFERPTIAELAELLAQDLAEDADDDLVAELLAELETLSEEDVASMLAENA